MIKILLTELLCYLLFLVFVYIEDPVMVTAFIALMIIAGFMLKKTGRNFLQEIEKVYAENLGKVGLLAAAIALTVPFAIMGDSYWLQILNFMMLNAIMALGLNFMTGRAGLICLGYAAFMAIGAYTVGSQVREVTRYVLVTQRTVRSADLQIVPPAAQWLEELLL